MKAPIKNADEFTNLFASLENARNPAQERLMLLLTVRLGLRPMEMAGLQRSWFREGELRIPLGYSKRKSGRSLPVNDEILEAVEALMGSRTGHVFLNREGQPFDPGGMSTAVKRIYKRAGVLGSAYSGRRSLASRLVDEGHNLVVIRDVLGHTDVSTTQRYVEVTPNKMRSVLFA